MSTPSTACSCGGRDSLHTDTCAFGGLYLLRVNAVIGYALLASNGDETEAYLALLGALLRFAGDVGSGTELLDAAAGAIAIASQKLAARMPPAPATKPGSVPS